MRCRDCQRELSALLDGELPAARRAAVETHVAECAGCRQRLAELRQVAAGVAALPRLQPSPQFVAEVRCKLHGGERVTWVERLFQPVWWKVPLEAAAALVVLGLAAVWVNQSREPAAVRSQMGAKADRWGPAMAESPRLREEVEGTAKLAAAAPVESSARAMRTSASDVLGRRQLVADTIVVEGADPATVQRQAAQVALALDGRVLPSARTAQTFQVELPPQNVLAFKSQLVEVSGQPERRKSLLSRDTRTNGPAGAMVAMTRETETAGELSDADGASAILEIQVVPSR